MAEQSVDSRVASTSFSESRQLTSPDSESSTIWKAPSPTTLAGATRSKTGKGSRPGSASRKMSPVARGNSRDFMEAPSSEKGCQQQQVELSSECFWISPAWMALKDFEKSTRLEEEQSQAYSTTKRLVASTECKTLINVGEQFLQIVGACAQPDWKVLRRLPTRMVQKALQLGCISLAPDLHELQRLKCRVQKYEEQHLASSRAYLEELVMWRSCARTDDKIEVEFEASDRYFWDALKVLPEELQGLATDVIIEKVKCFMSQREATTLGEVQKQLRQMQARVSELEVQEDSLKVKLAEAKVANIELETRLQLQEAKSNEVERRNMEDFCTAQRCRQAESLYFTEQQRNKSLLAENGNLREQLSESRAERLDHELNEAKRRCEVFESRALVAEKLAKKKDTGNIVLLDLHGAATQEVFDNGLGPLGDHLTSTTGDKRFSEWMHQVCKKLQAGMAALAEARDVERVMKEAAERQFQEAMEEMAECDDLVESHSDSEESEQEVQEVAPTSTETQAQGGSESCPKRVLFGMGPTQSRRKGTKVGEQIQAPPLGTEPQDQDEASRKLQPSIGATCSKDSMASEARDSLAPMENRQSMVSESGSSIGRRRTRRLSRMSNMSGRSHMSGGSGGTSHRMMWFQHRHEHDTRELATLRGQLTAQEIEVENLKSSIEGLRQDLADLQQELATTRVELKQALDSHLHPARVAQLKAELHQERHECLASANLNKALKKSIKALLCRLAQEPHKSSKLPRVDTVDEDIGYAVESSDRKVHNRLYEDALRRHRQLASILGSITADDPSEDDEKTQQGSRWRSFSTPSRILLCGDILEMIKVNAFHLAQTRAQPLFSQAVTLPANKLKKPPMHRPIALVPSSLEPVAPKNINKDSPLGYSYEEEQRVGSLVVWRRAAPSVGSTTAPSSPSPPPGQCSLPLSRPTSAQSHSAQVEADRGAKIRPSSAPQATTGLMTRPESTRRRIMRPESARFPNVTKPLPSKIRKKDIERPMNKSEQLSQVVCSTQVVLPSPRPKRPPVEPAQSATTLAQIALAAAASSQFAGVSVGDACCS